MIRHDFGGNFLQIFSSNQVSNFLESGKGNNWLHNNKYILLNNSVEI